MYGNNMAPVREGDEIDVKIEAIGDKGDGIAKKDGFVLVIPGTQVNDEVRVRVTKVLRRVGFAEVVGDSDDAPAEEPAAEEEAPVEEAAEPEADATEEASAEEETPVEEDAPKEEAPAEEPEAEEKPKKKKASKKKDAPEEEAPAEDSENFGEELEE